MATVAVVVACDRVNLTAPTGSTVSLTADRNVLPLGGQATVRAVVIESGGTPVHNGTVVTFQTTVGSLDPPTAETVNGIATTTFLAGGISGTAVVQAYSGGARSGGNGSAGGIEIRIGAAAASGNISVSATPPSVSQSGGTVAISALVFDAASNPLPGVNVQFASSTGTLRDTTALTDANGVARTTLHTTQTATVTAVAGAAKGEVRVDVSTAPSVTIVVPENGTVGVPVPITIDLPAPSGTAAPQQIRSVVVDLGDGNSRTFANITGDTSFTHTYSRVGGYTVTATTTDVSGNTGTASDSIVISAATLPTVGITADDTTPEPNTQAVTFTITASAPSGSTLTSVRATHNGEVVYSGTGPGSFVRRFPQGTHVVVATATDANGNEGRTQVTIVAGPP